MTDLLNAYNFVARLGAGQVVPLDAQPLTRIAAADRERVLDALRGDGLVTCTDDRVWVRTEA